MAQRARIKEAVRTTYANLATGQGCGCDTSTAPSCCDIESGGSRCGGSTLDRNVPEEAMRLSAGCGNPVDNAPISEGNIVLDVGSGGGIDVFRASKLVGEKGSVIGIDSTPEMVSKAREIATKEGYRNVEFRLGEIENMPIESGSIDVAISNCVLNLLPDKLQGFREIYRVLKPGGKLVISDLTTKNPRMPDSEIDPSSWAACVAGAVSKEENLRLLTKAGFRDLNASGDGPSTGLVSVTITGTKPKPGS